MYDGHCLLYLHMYLPGVRSDFSKMGWNYNKIYTFLFTISICIYFQAKFDFNSGRVKRF